MKLNFGRRLVLFVHWLLSLAGCALAVTLVVWPKCMETAQALLERQGLAFKIYAIAVLAVYLIFAVGAVCIILGGGKRKERDAFIVVDSSETGRTRIAVGAVDQMIRQAVRGVEGIAEMKATIINNDDSIAIAADVALINGAHVPTVTSNIKRAIRGYIEKNCGVTVRGVSVSVHSLAEAEQGRRGRRRRAEAPVENQIPVANAPETIIPEPIVPEPAPAEPIVPEPERFEAKAEPAAQEIAFDLPEEPIQLTLDSEPEVAAEVPADEPAAEVADAFASEAATDEPVVEPAAEPAGEAPAEEPAPKKRRFGKFFGKREEEAKPDAEQNGEN